MSIQLDFFFTPQESEMNELRKSQTALKMSLDKIRKGTYAEINSLKKVCVELSARQEIIERNICQK
jgi:hypothetical protein